MVTCEAAEKATEHISAKTIGARFFWCQFAKKSGI